jgi:hypothetical protein
MKNILNFVLFQSLWLSCILGAAHQIIWPAVIIVSSMLLLQLIPSYRHKNDGMFLYICIVMGFLLDSLLSYFGLIDYHYDIGFSHTAPFWILFLWSGFALTLNHSMAWLLNKPKIGTLFIIIGAPLSYYSAEKLKAIHINESMLTLSLISVMWLIVYHILLALNSLLNQDRGLRHA